MASQPQPGGTARAPPPPLAASVIQDCPVLLDWWLVRAGGEDGKICVAGHTTRKRPFRVITSGAIKTRHADGIIETEDGVTIMIKGPLNDSQMHQNGFPEKVCNGFRFGFPMEWEKRANSHLQQTGEQTAASSKSIKDCVKKLLSSRFLNSMGYVTESDLSTSVGSTSNTDGPPVRRLSNSRLEESTANAAGNHNSTSKVAASEELCNRRMGMPEETFADPEETCDSSQADDQHQSMHIDAREQEINNRSTSCESFKQSTGSVCSNSIVGSKRLEASEIASFKKGDCRNRVQHGSVVPAEECVSVQVEHDAEIQHENVSRYSSEQEIVTPSVHSASVDKHTDQIISDLDVSGTPICTKTVGRQGTQNALKVVPTKRMSPQTGIAQGSEGNTIRRLRSGKQYDFSLHEGCAKKKKTRQHRTSNRKTIPDEQICTPANLTSHENVYKSSGIRDKINQSSNCNPVPLERTRSGKVRQANSSHQNGHNVGCSVDQVIAADKAAIT